MTGKNMFQTKIYPKTPQRQKSRLSQLIFAGLMTLGSTASYAADVCEPDAFNTTSATTVINEIYRQGVLSGDCIGELFEINSDTAQTVFRTNTLNAVIDAADDLALNYGGGGDDNLASLFYFLRGAYYVDSLYSGFSINTSVAGDAANAIDRFVDNRYFKSNSAGNAELVYNAIVLIDSIGEHRQFYPMIKDWLSSWSQSYQDTKDMDLVIETILYLLKREFRENEDLMLDDPAVINALEDFLDNSWMLGTELEPQLAKGANLLGYFTTLEWYKQDNKIEATVDNALNNLFVQYGPTSSGKSLWGNAAGEASYWGDCSKYHEDVCNFESAFVEPLLNDVYYCDDFLNNGSNTRIRAQDMTTTQGRETCELLDLELTRFSARFGTTVVKNDNSDTLDMVIFDSKTDYQVYSPAIFGNNTNNGGIFLEGEPSNIDNEARFITFEYEDSNDPGFKIKNVEHEYVHYLDGRINKYGSFSTASPSNGGNTVWWSEGLGEYVAWQDNSEYAPDAMMEGYFTLSEVFNTDYNHSIAQIYDWGYAASRFMKECHGDDVDIILTNLRKGDYGSYRRYLEKIGTSYNNEFDDWTPGLAANESGSQTSRACYGTSTSASGISLSAQTISEGSSISVSLGETEEILFRIAVPSAIPEAINVTLTNEDGDVDIYVLADEAAYMGGYDCKNDDFCSVELSQNTPDYYYIMARGYYDDNSATLTVTFGESNTTPEPNPDNGSWPSTNNEFIDSFTLAGITKNTGDDGGYGDHSGQTAIALTDGDAIAIYSDASFSENWAAWIDLNDDGSFDAAEQVYSASGGSSTNGTISLPSGGNTDITGTHVMRIAMAYGETPDPLGLFASGEIEDWTVTIASTNGGDDDELSNGSSRVIAAGADEQVRAFINVPAGATNLVISIRGADGDADLYVNYGSYSSSSSNADCFNDVGGSNETCDADDIGATQSGTYYVVVKGYRDGSFSNVTL
ncbi:MAG: hypothetical protein ACI8WB_002620 [Phenylobacterium sp.]|jgi:hypothetical protein